MGSTKPCRLIFDSLNEAKVMAGSRRLIELSIKRRSWRSWSRLRGRGRSLRAGSSGREMLLAYRQGPVFLCGGPSLGNASSDGPALHRAGQGRRCDGGAGRASPSRQGADDHGRGQGVGGGAGVPEGRRSWAIRTSCGRRGFWPARPRAWAGGGARVPGGLAQGTVCKILDAEEVKPHKVRYYLERRDPEFKAKMARCCASTAR